MRSLFSYNKDYYGGALMILIGLAAVYQGTRYQLGTLARMGPGFFPTRWARSWPRSGSPSR